MESIEQILAKNQNHTYYFFNDIFNIEKICFKISKK